MKIHCENCEVNYEVPIATEKTLGSRHFFCCGSCLTEWTKENPSQMVFYLMGYVVAKKDRSQLTWKLRS